MGRYVLYFTSYPSGNWRKVSFTPVSSCQGQKHRLPRSGSSKRGSCLKFETIAQIKDLKWRRAPIWTLSMDLSTKMLFGTETGAKKTLKSAGAKIFSGSPNRRRKRWVRAIQFQDPCFLRSQQRLRQLTPTPNTSVRTTQKLMRWRTDNVMVLWMRSCVLGSMFIGVQKVGLIPGCTLNRNKT